MLPPGAASPAAGGSAATAEPRVGEKRPAAPSVDELLPPGAGPADLEKKQRSKQAKKRETVTFATTDGGHVTLEEPVKRVGNRELAPITPEEKAMRRLWRNVIVVGGCAIVLVAALAVLLWANWINT